MHGFLNTIRPDSPSCQAGFLGGTKGMQDRSLTQEWKVFQSLCFSSSPVCGPHQFSRPRRILVPPLGNSSNTIPYSRNRCLFAVLKGTTSRPCMLLSLGITCRQTRPLVTMSQTWWCTPLIPVLRNEGQGILISRLS